MERISFITEETQCCTTLQRLPVIELLNDASHIARKSRSLGEEAGTVGRRPSGLGNFVIRSAAVMSLLGMDVLKER